LNYPTFFSTITTHTAAGRHTTTTPKKKKRHTQTQREREKILYIEKREEEKEKEQQHSLIGSSLKDLVPTFFCWLQLPVSDM
jgi:hypothetical protein